MRVAIGVPSGDMVHADFANSLAAMLAFNTGQRLCDCVVINQKTSIIEKGRHEIVLQALQTGVDKLLFLDSDMVFPRQTLLRLLSHEKDIVACNYTTRRAPIKPVCRGLDFKLLGPGQGIKEVGYAATGCLLIDMKVFKEIGEPYFQVVWDPKKKCHYGEDYGFSVMARNKGFKIYCDMDLSNEVYHLGMHAFCISDLQVMEEVKNKIIVPNVQPIKEVKGGIIRP